MSFAVEQCPLTSVAVGLPPRVVGKLRALHNEGDTLYASCGRELFASVKGSRFEFIASAPASPAARAAASTTLSSRFFRTGFHALTPLPNGDLVAVVRGAVLHSREGSRNFRVAHEVTRGTRPLGVCSTPTGSVYFGEYFGNPERDEVHVYGSPDGKYWEPVHTFEAGSIRHIHGIHWDPYRKGLWILTGDDGDEVGLWWTSDEFRTLEPVIRGDQRARAVTVLPLEDGVIVPMDTPFEENWVQHFDTASGKLERLAALPGSVFCATRTSSLFALSTVVEKSTVNTDQRASLYISRNGYDWQPAARLERDLAWLGDRRGYLQYPTLLLPTGTSNTPDLLATGQSVAGAHGRLLRWSATDLQALLEPAASLRRSA